MQPVSILTYRLTIPVKTRGDATTLKDLLEATLKVSLATEISKQPGSLRRRWVLKVWIKDIELDAIKGVLGTRAYGQETFTS